MIDLNVLARLAKVIALIGFLLPWVVVSCSGTEIAHGSGIDMMMGKLHESDQIRSLQQQSGAATSDNPLGKAGPDALLIGAAAAIVLGLFASLLLRKRAAAAALLAGAVLGAGLCFASFEQARHAMTEAMTREQHHGQEAAAAGDDSAKASLEMQNSMREQMSNAIQLQKKEGFWTTVIALIIAAVFAAASLGGLRVMVSPPPKPT